MIYHRCFKVNVSGNDFFVGDIHGEYELLIRSLNNKGFNYTKDRLFAVGDLIDRGPNSMKCLGLLNESWFNSTIGNHEAMLLCGATSEAIRKQHLRNGGAWFSALSEQDKSRCITLIEEKMPLACTVQTSMGTVGVVHAAAPNDWGLVVSGQLNAEQSDWCLWSTETYQQAMRNQSKPISNVDLVVHGHVNCLYVERGANEVWLDTLLQSGRLSVLTLDEVFEL